MAKKHLGWLIALLAATPGLYVACGGDESTPSSTGTAGTGGTGGATGSGGSGGATTGGTAGTADGGGSAGKAGGTPEAGVMCGGMTCSTNPTSTNICDTANNRCVDCLTDADCAVETLNKVCDTRLNAMSMLPAYNCVQCLSDANCPMGSTCSMMGNNANTCITACGTANCTTNPTGNNICDLPNNRCVGCLADSDCADEMTDKTCDLRPAGMSMLPAGNCVQCTVDTQCPSGQVCSTMGNTANTCVTSCGTTTCTTNPTGTNICDLPNNRCIDCLTDVDCEVETNNKRCDTSVNPTNMLPRDNCVECTADAHCPTGEVCIGNNCQASCTTDAQCSTDGGGMNPHCNPTTKICAECGSDSHCSGTTPYCIPAGTCEQCTTDAHCAAQTTRILCNTTNNTCVQCIDSTQCTPPATCGRQGTCTGGGPADGGGGGG
jgi:Cys-rich repeat protein